MQDADRELLSHKINSMIERLEIILETNNVIEKQTNKELHYDESVQLDILSQQPIDANLKLLAKQELTRLKANLNWLKGKEAGECEECGNDIPMRRLLAVPTTRKCINCANASQSTLEPALFHHKITG